MLFGILTVECQEGSHSVGQQRALHALVVCLPATWSCFLRCRGLGNVEVPEDTNTLQVVCSAVLSWAVLCRFADDSPLQFALGGPAVGPCKLS